MSTIYHRTCVIYDEKLVSYVSDAELRSFIENKLEKRLKLDAKKGRLLNDKEIAKLNALTNNTLLSEKDSYTLGSSCELVNRVVSSTNKNGLMFVSRGLDLLKSCCSTSFETLLIDQIQEKHDLKRVMVLNWDREANDHIETHFYADARSLQLFLSLL